MRTVPRTAIVTPDSRRSGLNAHSRARNRVGSGHTYRCGREFRRRSGPTIRPSQDANARGPWSKMRRTNPKQRPNDSPTTSFRSRTYGRQSASGSGRRRVVLGRPNPIALWVRPRAGGPDTTDSRGKSGANEPKSPWPTSGRLAWRTTSGAASIPDGRAIVITTTIAGASRPLLAGGSHKVRTSPPDRT